MVRPTVAVFAAALLFCGAAHAGHPELDRIPASIPPPQPPSRPSALIGTNYIEAEASLIALRDRLVVPLPGARGPRWSARLFLDSRLRWHLARSLDLVYSGRLNLRAEDGLAFPSHESVRNDWRELYLDWHPASGVFVEAGRINLKNGVALGFNPTDFFKTRAVVEPTSADPSVLRDDRLGTVMVTGQYLWAGGALTLALAPKIARAPPLYDARALPSFDPMVGRTNAKTRLLAKLSLDLAPGFSPEVLVYHSAGRTRVGFNLSAALGQSTIAYVEWAGGPERDLVSRAWAFGIATGIVPAGSAPPFPAAPHRKFRSDLAAGLTYTLAAGPTLGVEYEFSEGGFSPAQWHGWFAGGDAQRRAALWLLRGYAGEEQAPLARHSVFVSLDWRDAFVRDLHLSGFADIDARDGSAFAQASVEYFVSDRWTVGALVNGAIGGGRTDFGSLPTGATVMLRLRRYL